MGERRALIAADPARTERRVRSPATPGPEAAGAAWALGLQRTAGNRAVSQALAPSTQALRPLPGGGLTRPLPPMPVVESPSSDQSPAQTSETVPASVAAVVPGIGANLLRAALGPPPDTRPTGPATSTMALSGGSPLDESTRAPFERALGYDLSPVRIHRGDDADRAAQATNALAFSLGDHIVLSRSLDLSAPAGRHVLGHELVHTVQGRLGSAGGMTGGRISDPSWSSEREAESGAASLIAGRAFQVQQAAGADVHRIAPWLILAGIGLAAGLIIWAASDSPEENRAKHAAGAPNASADIWALVPVYGSIQQIREADSYFQRVLGVGFLMLDCATIGTAGIAAKALIKAPAALIRTAVARQGAVLAVKEGGEIATELAAKETAAAFSREGGTLLASQAAASNEMFAALQRGAMVVVTEGGLNHAAIYARNAAGQVVRLHGGPLKVLFTEAGRELTSAGTKSMAKRVNAYLVLEAGEATVSLEQAVARVSQGGPAALRWIGGNPTSCGIMQGALLEASGLSAETLAKLLPAGGAAGRMLPISILGQMASSGGLRFVEGGMGRIIGGTAIQGTTLAVGGGLPALTSSAMRFIVTNAVDGDSPADSPTDSATAAETAAAPDQRSRESDDAAIAIVNRYGRSPVGPLNTIANSIGDVVPGWYVRNAAFHTAVARSLIRIGMDPTMAREITGSSGI